MHSFTQLNAAMLMLIREETLSPQSRLRSYWCITIMKTFKLYSSVWITKTACQTFKADEWWIISQETFSKVSLAISSQRCITCHLTCQSGWHQTCLNFVSFWKAISNLIKIFMMTFLRYCHLFLSEDGLLEIEMYYMFVNAPVAADSWHMYHQTVRNVD